MLEQASEDSHGQVLLQLRNGATEIQPATMKKGSK